MMLGTHPIEPTKYVYTVGKYSMMVEYHEYVMAVPNHTKSLPQCLTLN